ncbi:hypothetical protein [Streptomyces sp. NBC_00154]|uniref:hypothetical protein n=1 Tax=Streptomyces sp. NBC_00154 TaxID=2975670 RepID=UPI00225ABC2B|nr:hypothetical protein [Streptomyces sp. NBC_00154]MCX5318110.1 hypothetical protein [Streptomyces sp. NBC_00154]
MAHSTTPAARREAAAKMRAIATRRPLPTRGRDFHCAPCSTAWTGAEADCWSCGLPATQEHAHPGTGLQLLLNAVGRTPKLPQPQLIDKELEEVR